MHTNLINQIHEDTHVDRFAIQRVLGWLTETQIVTYTYPDPQGCNFVYPDLYDLTMDLGTWAEGNSSTFPVFMQIEFREPVCGVRFVDHKPELVQ